MPSPRWLAGLAVPMMFGAALVANTAIATADPADGAYLSQLRGAGFSWPPEHDAALTAMGRFVCDDLSWGWNYDSIAQSIHTNLDSRNVTFGNIGTMVGIAHSTYCPGQQCWGGAC